MKTIPGVMTLTLSLIMLTVTGFGVGVAAEEVDREAEADRIRELSRQWVEAVKTGDVDTIAGLYTEDGLIMPPDAPQGQGAEAVKAFWAEVAAMPKVSVTFAPTTVEVAEAGDMAYDIGTYQLSFEGDEGPVEDRGKYVVVWVKEGGAWRAAADIFNSDGPQD